MYEYLIFFVDKFIFVNNNVKLMLKAIGFRNKIGYEFLIQRQVYCCCSSKLLVPYKIVFYLKTLGTSEKVGVLLANLQ